MLQPKPHGPIQLGRLAHGREQLEATLELTQSTLETTAAMEDVEQAALEVPLAITTHKTAGTMIYARTSTMPQVVQATQIVARHILRLKMTICLVELMAVLRQTPATQLLHLPRNLSVLNEHSI